MSGQSGIRGYLVQSLICVLDSFEDLDWTEVTLEPNLVKDKVDILWQYSTKSKAAQVKSSQNQIAKSDCISWVNELESSYAADEYELRLIGPVNADVASMKSYSKTKIPIPNILNIEALLDQCSNKFDKFLEQIRISKVPVFAREILIRALVTKFESYSTGGKQITRADFTKTFNEWILSIYPNSINEAAEELRIRFETRNRIDEAKFKLKYDACLEALSIVDEFYAVSYGSQLINGKNIPGTFKKLDPFALGEKARSCHNKLVLTCDSPKVIEYYKRILKFDRRDEDGADFIVDFRMAIRKELGFGSMNVDEDRKKAWIFTCG